ncbi:hypothetical protein V8E52_006751 [Russula decolorans]
MASISDMDHIIAALGQSNRVCEVFLLDLAHWQLEKVLAAMQVPFPELTDLRLSSYGKTLLVIADSFLDGSAPRLQEFTLGGIPIGGLPNLLLSATHLPRNTFLGFQSPQSRPDRGSRRPPPSRRSILSALRRLDFKGFTEDLEKLVTRIDTPQPDETFCLQIDYDCPQLTQFINRTPTLGERNKAHGESCRSGSRRHPDRQLSSIAQICNSYLHPLSTVEDLYIERQSWRYVWKNDTIEMKNLYLSNEFAPCIAAALQELVGDRITEVLPSLQNIFVEGLKPLGRFREHIGQFVAARQLSDHSIAISVWDENSL